MLAIIVLNLSGPQIKVTISNGASAESQMIEALPSARSEAGIGDDRPPEDAQEAEEDNGAEDPSNQADLAKKLAAAAGFEDGDAVEDVTDPLPPQSQERKDAEEENTAPQVAGDVRAEPEDLAEPEEPVGEEPVQNQYRAQYGFYLHVYQDPAAVIFQVRSVKKHFPDSPIYVMSDGGLGFAGLCESEGCNFKLCPPANDRWHPWPFLHRMYEAAVWLNSEFVIMLEPDNTIHGPITRHPQADAGGIPTENRDFSQKAYVQEQAQERNPGFKWTHRSQNAGLAGGAYFRTAAILDAFTDDRIAAIDWTFLSENSKEVYSSDFAMQYALALRGWEIEPWMDAAQMDRDKDNPIQGAKDSAFRHYCACYPGGKPTYNLRVEPEDKKLYEKVLPHHARIASVCQICYNLTKYKLDWGSDDCTNPHPVKYRPELLQRYFPDGDVPVFR